jgi:GT2 family glycosyltransferase
MVFGQGESITTSSIASVAVVLVNFRGAHDTLECLESLFRSTYKTFRVIVVDNWSEDDSIEILCNWAFDHRSQLKERPDHISEVFQRPLQRPESVALYSSDGNKLTCERRVGTEAAPPRLTLIRHKSNSGFSAANNLAVSYVLSVETPQYLWFLNNDTVVMPETMRQLVECCASNSIVGARLFHYDQPSRVQCYGGGRLNRFSGHNRNLTYADTKLDYLTGASVFMRTESCIKNGKWDENNINILDE